MTLTHIIEIDIKILKFLDITSLIQFYQVNVYAQNLCRDEYLWKQKFLHDAMPIFATPITFDDWISEYDLVTRAQSNIFSTLTVNTIEAIRDSDATNGRIITYIKNLPHTLYQKLNITINTDRFFMIKLDYIDDDVYTVTFFIRLSSYNYEQLEVMTWNYQKTVDFLTYISYNIKLGKRAGIFDGNFITFNMTTERLNNLMLSRPMLYCHNRQILVKRIAIWDTLKYFKIDY